MEWDGKYRTECAPRIRCLQGCHTNEPCYFAMLKAEQKPLEPEFAKILADNLDELVFGALPAAKQI